MINCLKLKKYFWSSNYLLKLTPDEKLLYLYFITNCSNDSCGILKFDVNDVSRYTGLSIDRINKIIKKLQADRKIKLQGSFLSVKDVAKFKKRCSFIPTSNIKLVYKDLPSGLYNWLVRNLKEEEELSEQFKFEKDWMRHYSRNYYLRNKEKIKKYQNAWQNNEYKVNLNFRLSKCMGNAIAASLKGKKNGRKWSSLVGYDVDELMQHLEKQFTPEMNWDNYGTYWEIDHIIPRSYFKYKSAEEPGFKVCWSLKNLRPLEKSANRVKHSKLLLEA